MAKLLFRFGEYDFGEDAYNMSWDTDFEAPSHNLMREDGSISEGTTVLRKTFRIEGELVGSSNAALRDTRDRFVKGLTQGNRMKRLWIFDDRYYHAEVTSITCPEYSGLNYLPFTVTFTAYDPFEYLSGSATAYSINTNSVVWVGYDNTKILNTKLFNNKGSKVYPYIKIKGMTVPIEVESRSGGNLILGSDLSKPNPQNGCIGKYWDETDLSTGNTFYLEPSRNLYGMPTRPGPSANMQVVTRRSGTAQAARVSQKIPIGPGMAGTIVTCSMWFYRGTGTGVGGTYQEVLQYKADGTWISEDVARGTTYNSAIGFTRDKFSFTLNAETAWIRWCFVQNDYTYGVFMMPQLEIGNVLTDYKACTFQKFSTSSGWGYYDFLNLDCSQKTVELQQNKSIAYSQPVVYENFLHQFTGEFIYLSEGYNHITFKADTTTSTYSNIIIEWVPRYL